MSDLPENDIYAGPKTSPYKVWHIPQVPMPAFVVKCDTLPEAFKIQDVLARYDLFQYKNNIKPDYANASGILEWSEDASEYWEVEDDDPRVIDLAEQERA